jgi:RimJ/RimL family protein N-acetyltransferase
MAHIFTDKAGQAIEVRLAVENDAEALIAFTRRVDTESLYLSREPGEFNVPVPTERLFIRQTNAQKNSAFWVALRDGDIVGSIDFHGGARQRILHAGEFGMSVRQDHWGLGLGAHLLDVMIAWARTNGLTRKIKLRVQTTLYRSRGFVDEGLLRREFRVRGEWVDTLMMALWLGPEDDATTVTPVM